MSGVIKLIKGNHLMHPERDVKRPLSPLKRIFQVNEPSRIYPIEKYRWGLIGIMVLISSFIILILFLALPVSIKTRLVFIAIEFILFAIGLFVVLEVIRFRYDLQEDLEFHSENVMFTHNPMTKKKPLDYSKIERIIFYYKFKRWDNIDGISFSTEKNLSKVKFFIVIINFGKGRYQIRSLPGYGFDALYKHLEQKYTKQEFRSKVWEEREKSFEDGYFEVVGGFKGNWKEGLVNPFAPSYLYKR